MVASCNPAQPPPGNVSHAVFATLINVSLNTVESWEQGARRPREATLKLLTIAHAHPEILLPRSPGGAT